MLFHEKSSHDKSALEKEIKTLKAQLKKNETDLTLTAKMTPEMKEMVETMQETPLLNFELLAQYNRFKDGGVQKV